MRFASSLSLETPSERATLDEPDSSLVRALLYFDVFRYPLSAREAWMRCDCADLTLREAERRLERLAREGFLRKRGEFYIVGDDDTTSLRREQNARAERYAWVARFFSRLIGAFPFTRAVMMSGSYSKGCMDAGADLDFFIVAAPRRVWLNRTLLILFKKTALLNSRKFFCVNYFVSADAMEIPDRNVFTAVEIAFLLPTYNVAVYEEFMRRNEWRRAYLPHFPLRSAPEAALGQSGFVKRALERLLSGAWGDALDDWCFRATVRRQQKKFAALAAEEFTVAMRSTKSAAKHHPQNFQKRTLQALARRCAEFEARAGVRLF